MNLMKGVKNLKKAAKEQTKEKSPNEPLKEDPLSDAILDLEKRQNKKMENFENLMMN